MLSGVREHLRVGLVDGPRSGRNGFRLAAALALALHAALALGRDGLWGGGDLAPHLRLIEQTAEQSGLHNTYAPAYHLLGAVAMPLLGFELYVKLFSLLAAVLLIAGFRCFQRAAGLPDAASAIFALNPYLLSLSWCTPRIEAAGYGLLLLGLAGLLRGRVALVALLLAATFAVHTASALLFGIAGGVLCLARRDARGLAALAAGTLLASPLVAAQMAAGCSFGEALLFARGGYARGLHERVLPEGWPWLVPLANPVALGAALLGATALWRRHRAVALLCGVLTLLYFNNVWLAPFGQRTLVTLLRGLSLLAIPVSIAAALFVADRVRLRAALVALTAVWALVSSVWVVPEACFVRPVSLEELRGLQVSRCTFTWRGAAIRPPAGYAPGS